MMHRVEAIRTPLGAAPQELVEQLATGAQAGSEDKAVPLEGSAAAQEGPALLGKEATPDKIWAIRENRATPERFPSVKVQTHSCYGR